MAGKAKGRPVTLGDPMRLIIVARPAVAAMCNQAAANAAPDGGSPFNVPLRLAGDASNAVKAYWCSWQMSAAVGQALRTYMTNHGATAAETKVYDPGQSPPNGNRIAIYQDWTPEQVLADLGLDRLAMDSV